MLKDFKSYQDFELSSEDRAAMKDLRNSSHWTFLKLLVEEWMMKLNANSLTGTEIEKGSSVEEFKDLRAFVQRWRRLVSMIELKEEQEPKL